LSRHQVLVRDAGPEDVEALLDIWSELVRRTPERSAQQAPADDAWEAVSRVATDPDERLLVGLIDGKVVGAAHLVCSRISPLQTDLAVSINHLHVLPGHRRNGLGRALVEAAVAWAEERETSHVLATAFATSRDANRFLARLGLAQVATVRAAAVGALRAKLPVEPPVCARVAGRSQRTVGQVLAQRRLLRRAQGSSGEPTAL
jgi:GNAT superfamily N-acetyltransferase